jgi:hypothetical protein
MIRFQDAADAAGRDFLNFYLQQMAAAEVATGHRLVDVMDVHWYPEARGACVGNPMDGCRITDNNNETAVVAARIAAPRSLWDSTYVENSWIAQSLGNQAINLLPRLKSKITTNYPGTKLESPSTTGRRQSHLGRLPQADVLGIFGRVVATLWPSEQTSSLTVASIFRNYDGTNGSSATPASAHQK